MKFLHLLAGTVVAVLGSGCSGDDAAPDADVTGVVLTIDRAEEQTTLGAQQVEPGNMFAVIDVKIANKTARAVPVAPTTFRLRTDQKLELAASELSLKVPEPCPIDALLAPSGAHSCTLVFELARFVTPVALVYSNGADVETQAAIMFDRCERCDNVEDANVCVDILDNVAHCGACDKRAPDHGVCTDGVPGCGDLRLCGDFCVSSDAECSMVVTTNVRESCVDTCMKNGKTCSTGRFFSFPEARYVCADGSVSLDGLLLCSQIPAPTREGCSFSVNRCLCN